MSEGSSPSAEATETSSAGTTTGATASHAPLLPPGLAMPKPLQIEGNLATNWKRFKRNWDNYAIVVRLNHFEENFKTGTFLSCIGEAALEIFEGSLTDKDRTKYEVVVTKFSELCLRETNETYERFIFNSRQKSNEESIDQYVTTLKTRPNVQFLCMFARLPHP
jgi:hypothetical protein